VAGSTDAGGGGVKEKAFSEQFVKQFGERFDLYPEVWLRHPVHGSSFRIDFIGFDREKELIGPVGFEVKDPARWSGPDGHFTNFTAAIKQCCDYSEMVVQSQFKDSHYDEFVGKRLRYVFLYRVDAAWAYGLRLDGQPLSNRAIGALSLAGKYGVGAACFDPNSNDWLLTLAGNRAFSLNKGISPLMLKHNVANRKGSAV